MAAPGTHRRPSPTKDFLGDTESVPLLSDHFRLYPVHCKLSDLIHQTELNICPKGETRYFAYHGVRNLRLGGCKVDATACGGKFCDRQVVSVNVNEHVPCGCFYRKDRHKIVTQHVVQIPCDRAYREVGQYTVAQFRSYRFDQLLFQGESRKLFHEVYKPDDAVATRVLRKRVKDLVELVNRAHGWTVIGWVRTGAVKDSSDEGDRDALDIASEDLQPHIIYLYPTDMQDLETVHQERYERIVITIENFKEDVDEEKARLRREEEREGGRAN